ncbi:hypothetical protein [Vreelandella sp. EE22]
MPYDEAKEHVQGRLHHLFADPYQAFEKNSPERELHIKVVLYVLLARPMAKGLVTLRVVHGWENGSCEPDELQHIDYSLTTLDDFRAVVNDFDRAPRQNEPLPSSSSALLASPLADAIAQAEAEGVTLSPDIQKTPARWPAFEGGLALYTLFKMYHRLVYGEDDTYRCSRCQTPQGFREMHEFHLEEGEFALLAPPRDHAAGEATILVLHESQLGPIERLFEQSLPLLDP